MTTVREEVVAAFERGDQAAIRRLGWWPVWDAAATWWAPRQTCTFKEFVPYAKLLGDHDPVAVLEALRELAAEWRPHPASVRGYLHRHDHAVSVDVGRNRDPASSADALQAVGQALAAGERGCSCGSHRATWLHDSHYVLRCGVCGGLEQGQLYAAEDGGLLAPEEAA